MSNMARYWFKGFILWTKPIEDMLKDFGFVQYKYCRDIPKTHYIALYDTFEYCGEKSLTHLFAEASQIAWKQDFEEACRKLGIPIQMWQEC